MLLDPFQQGMNGSVCRLARASTFRKISLAPRDLQVGLSILGAAIILCAVWTVVSLILEKRKKRRDSRQDPTIAETRQLPGPVAGVRPAVHADPTPVHGTLLPVEVLPSPVPTRFFYLGADSEVLGPFSHDELRALVQGGTLTGETLVCAEGNSEWKPLDESLQDRRKDA